VLDLTDSTSTSKGEAPVSFVTEQEGWDALDRIVLSEAKEDTRVEIWVTAVGQFRTTTAGSPLGPCDRIVGGYGHLGAFPAQLVIKRVSDIVVKPNPEVAI
jgi:hypothetical protein